MGRQRICEPPDIPGFPVIDDAAFYGISREVADLATEHSEADPIAVLGSFLASSAAMLGDKKILWIGDTRHYARLFVTLAGMSSKARKGTSFQPVKRVINKVHETVVRTAERDFGIEPLKIESGGLSSAEGLITLVRDEEENAKGEIVDEGVKDKRLLVVEEEFANVLSVCQREGNTLSATLRRAYDGGTLAPVIKNNRITATDPHSNIIGHITQHELCNKLDEVEMFNGLANRFLWLCVRRPKLVPFPAPMDDSKVLELAIELSAALKAAQEPGEMTYAPCAREYWMSMYPKISKDAPGVLASVTARGETIVARIAMVHALLEGKTEITADHMKAAVALWRFSVQSVRFLFDPVNDYEHVSDAGKIIQALKGNSGSMTQTEISRLFSGHKKAAELRVLLAELQGIGRIEQKVETPGDGRPVTHWSLIYNK